MKLKHSLGLVSMTLALSSSLSLVAFDASADPTQKQLDEARDAFKAGLEKEKAGDYTGALAKFEITAKVKATPQVRFHIALCHDKLGKLKQAADEYDQAAKEAEEKKVAEVTKAAPMLAQKARERLAKITITYAKNVAPTKVLLDGAEIDKDEAHGAGMTVDPGAHVLVAVGADGKEFRSEFKLTEKEDKWITVALATEEPVKPVEPVDTKIETKTEPVEDAPVSDKPAKDLPVPSSSLKTYGLVIGGFGIVSLGLSAAFYGVRVAAVNDLDGQCTSDLRCPQSSGPTLDRAKTFTTLSRVALGVGVVSVGAGAYLFFKGKSEEAKSASVRFVPYAPSASVGFGMEGVF